MTARVPAFLTRRLAVLTLGHFTIDTYSSFFLPLLPLLSQRLGLNYAMVGGLTAMASMSSSFLQPLFCSACSPTACGGRGSWRWGR